MRTTAAVLLTLAVLAIVVSLAVTGFGARVTAFAVPVAWGLWCVVAGARHNQQVG